MMQSEAKRGSIESYFIYLTFLREYVCCWLLVFRRTIRSMFKFLLPESKTNFKQTLNILNDALKLKYNDLEKANFTYRNGPDVPHLAPQITNY